MMRRKRCNVLGGLLLIAVCTAVSGCASELLVWKEAETVAGLPFRATQLYLKIGVYTKHTKLQACVHKGFVTPLVLPTGDQYFVNVDSAALAKTGFTVKYNDQGALAEVTMNSEPSSAPIDSLTNALTELLPFAGILPDTQEDVDTAEAGVDQADRSGPACDTGESSVRFILFDENREPIDPFDASSGSLPSVPSIER